MNDISEKSSQLELESINSAPGSQNSFNSIAIIFGRKLAQFKVSIRAKFLPDTFICALFAYWEVWYNKKNEVELKTVLYGK